MVTTSRVIVVLRSELGLQMSLAQKELKKIIEEKFKTNTYSEWSNEQTREFYRWQNRIKRIENAIQALGTLQLGDIEDKEYEGKF